MVIDVEVASPVVASGVFPDSDGGPVSGGDAETATEKDVQSPATAASSPPPAEVIPAAAMPTDEAGLSTEAGSPPAIKRRRVSGKQPRPEATTAVPPAVAATAVAPPAAAPPIAAAHAAPTVPPKATAAALPPQAPMAANPPVLGAFSKQQARRSWEISGVRAHAHTHGDL